MKRVVVYQSSTGFTKKYAEWIAEELKCEAVNMKNAKADMISSQDQVIYGGWIFANKIAGYDKLLKMNPKNVVLFAVGGTQNDMVDISNIKLANQIDTTPLFYMQGGINYEKQNFLVRAMLKKIAKSRVKTEKENESGELMGDKMCKSFDITDKKFILPLLEAVK